MKTMKLLFTLLFVATFATVGLGQVGIENSLHDFSTTDWANGEICIACHTPHNGNPTAGAVLWNHDLTVTAFTVYDNTVSGTMDATVGQPSGSSKLCLSCHDGTVALEDFGGSTAGTSTNITGSALFTSDLTNDHPISFDYNVALSDADAGLVAAGDGAVTALLMSGKVECASCHDVHNSTGFGKLLRVDNSASALCLTCHNK